MCDRLLSLLRHWWWWEAQPSIFARRSTTMLIIGIVLAFVALAYLCWLLFALAVYALPFFALCGRPHKANYVACHDMWRTRTKRFCGVRRRASYATYFRVDDRCPPSWMEDRSCTTNSLRSRRLSLVIAPSPTRNHASNSCGRRARRATRQGHCYVWRGPCVLWLRQFTVREGV